MLPYSYKISDLYLNLLGLSSAAMFTPSGKALYSSNHLTFCEKKKTNTSIKI